MSYMQALSEAGAHVHAFKSFGSYQGDWFAFITYGAEQGWVHGMFGSCSHCDAFESEFGDCASHCEDHYDEEDQVDCPRCREHAKEYILRLADFGRTYCESIQDLESIRAMLQENAAWDSESETALQWVLEMNKEYAL